MIGLLAFLLMTVTSCGTITSAVDSAMVLNLSRKNLTEIPEYVYEIKNLKTLKLYGNSLDSISYRIGELENDINGKLNLLLSQ